MLVRGSFVSTRVYIMIKTDFPEEFRIAELSKELAENGFDPGKTRLVLVAVNASEPVEGTDTYPEIQIVMIPF